LSFLDTIETVRAFLQRQKRVSFRALRREFSLDEETLTELIDELVQVQRIAKSDGGILIWVGTE
jgi:hypothetical protein